MAITPCCGRGNPCSIHGPCKALGVAQLVEQWTVVPLAGCSNHPLERA